MGLAVIKEREQKKRRRRQLLLGEGIFDMGTKAGRKPRATLYRYLTGITYSPTGGSMGRELEERLRAAKAALAGSAAPKKKVRTGKRGPYEKRKLTDLQLQVLRVLGLYGEPVTVIRLAATVFGRQVSDIPREGSVAEGGSVREVRNALRSPIARGLVEKVPRGLVQLTAAGRDLVASN